MTFTLLFLPCVSLLRMTVCVCVSVWSCDVELRASHTHTHTYTWVLVCVRECLLKVQVTITHFQSESEKPEKGKEKEDSRESFLANKPKHFLFFMTWLRVAGQKFKIQKIYVHILSFSQLGFLDHDHEKEARRQLRLRLRLRQRWQRLRRGALNGDDSAGNATRQRRWLNSSPKGLKPLATLQLSKLVQRARRKLLLRYHRVWHMHWWS